MLEEALKLTRQGIEQTAAVLQRL